MSQTPTISQPEPLTSSTSRLPPSPHPAEGSPFLETVQELRAECVATTERARQARLLTAIADLEERAGDEPGAARDYLAAYNADQTFREPLEGLVRLLERRRSLKNLGKLVDALVRASAAPDEKVRALLMRSAYQADVANDLAEAKKSALEATHVDGAPPAERASAWLALEVLSGQAGDSQTRTAALGQRAKGARDPTWRALLLIDCARMAATEPTMAAALLEEARALRSPATWAATSVLEALADESAQPRPPDGDPLSHGEPHHRPAGDVRSLAEALAEALDATSLLIEEAVRDPAAGDAAGVPQWVRSRPRLVDAWLRSAEARRTLGQVDRAAAILDHALAYVRDLEGDDATLAEGAVVNARIRVAEQTGDTALAAQLAKQRLSSEKDGPLAAALAMRIAEQAASEGDSARALEALTRAVASDPGCLPARALQLDMLADRDDASAFAAQVESFAEHLDTDDARGKAFLLAAYVWAVNARDIAGAKAALSQAAMYGMAPSITGRVARALASICDDVGWYEDATKRLLASGGDGSEIVSLNLELVRLRHSRGDAEGEARALRDMAVAPAGGWLARALEAFLPATAGGADGAGDPTVPGRRRAALEELAALERDPEMARGLALVAAVRAHAAGDLAGARHQLRELSDREPSDPLVVSMLTDLDRSAGDHGAAARVASHAAAATADGELAAALRFEAAFERWREGDRKGALRELECAAVSAPEAATMLLGWAARGVDVDSVEGRRRGIERASQAGIADPRVLALERFATEVGGGDPDAAAAALATVDAAPQGDLGVAAALARVAWSQGSADSDAIRDAIARIGARGPGALALASAERTRVAREAGDQQELSRAAKGWFYAGGGLAAAIEWLAAAMSLGEPQEDVQARLGVAAAMTGDPRDAMLASAAILRVLAEPDAPVPFLDGKSPCVRLANLELSPPGCDPRRRTMALSSLDEALGAEARDDATSLVGWAALAGGDVGGALAAFRTATTTRPDDVAAWEGLRSCAEAIGDSALRARAAAELGARCSSAARGAAFWEEAALEWLHGGDEVDAERALERSFARDATRAVAFDKLFRRVRARKDNDHLLTLIERRLHATDDSAEIQKLCWEQARALREKGDQEAALEALEHVTMLDPDHVGALALLGEINIRRGRFDDAASSLARLAMLDGAPARNRVTAGVAAVDLYENKLDRQDKALEVLLCLHRAKLSTLPVRERLARAAARTGAWNEATSMLEELMNERADSAGRIEAARLAMGIYRDRLVRAQGATAAIVKLLEESPADGEAIDLLLETQQPPELRARLLERARDTLVDTLRTRPTDVGAVRRLANVAHALSDDALHRAALGVLATLGAAESRSEQTLLQLATKRSRPPQIAIGHEMLRGLLAPGDEGPIADLFVLLGATLTEALGPTLQACGVGRRDKVDPRSGLALRNEIAAWAGAFGIQQFDLYVGGSDPLGAQGIPGSPPSLVIGAGINAPMSSIARARVARELLAVVRGTTVARLRDDVTIAAIVVTACKLAEMPIEHPPYAVLAEVERVVSKAIARRTRKLISDACRAIVTGRLDPRAWSRRAVASHDRIGVIASGDPTVVLCDVLGVSREGLAQAVAGNARAEEALRFVLSSEYLQFRRLLGIDEGEVR
jgi:cellulose synthase operon protein C